MRRLSLLFLLLAAASSRASADGFVDFFGGIAAPLGDNNWTNLVDTSPKLGVRAGGLNGAFGGLLQVDWTPENHNAQNSAYASFAGHRFRVLVQGLAMQHVAPKISIVERAGAGIDVAYASYDIVVIGSHSTTDVGVGFEFGGGVWIDVSPSMQLGGELAVPIGLHSHKASSAGDITLDYTSYDLDVLFGVRLWSR